MALLQGLEEAAGRYGAETLSREDFARMVGLKVCNASLYDVLKDEDANAVFLSDWASFLVSQRERVDSRRKQKKEAERAKRTELAAGVQEREAEIGRLKAEEAAFRRRLATTTTTTNVNNNNNKDDDQIPAALRGNDHHRPSLVVTPPSTSSRIRSTLLCLVSS